MYKKTNLDTLKDPFFELKQVTDDLKIQNTTVTPLDDAFYIQVLPNPLKDSQLIKEEPSKDSQLNSEELLNKSERISVDSQLMSEESLNKSEIISVDSQWMSEEDKKTSEGALKRLEIITVQVVNRHIKQYESKVNQEIS